jgi:hypothetical protein
VLLQHAQLVLARLQHYAYTLHMLYCALDHRAGLVHHTASQAVGAVTGGVQHIWGVSVAAAEAGMAVAKVAGLASGSSNNSNRRSPVTDRHAKAE